VSSLGADSDKGLVLLTGSGQEHRYVANRLCRCVPLVGIVSDQAVHRASLRRAFRGGLATGVSRIGHHALRRAIHDESSFQRVLPRVLGQDLCDRFERPDLVTSVTGINSQEAHDSIAALEPDALAVFGTTIVGPETLGLAKELAFNLHTGISPRYRGTDCAFWPVVNGEPEWLGATVHECTAEVDGGQIFAVTKAAWEPEDGVHELFARAVLAGADLYVDVLSRYVQGGAVVGTGQDLSTGREYRGYMRTLGPELKARWALRRGLLRSPVSATAEA
jgi:folate-dependent phosphoribosylglycinamide formyltransferase PurN